MRCFFLFSFRSPLSSWFVYRTSLSLLPTDGWQKATVLPAVNVWRWRVKMWKRKKIDVYIVNGVSNNNIDAISLSLFLCYAFE